MQSSSKIILILANLALLQVASSLPSGSHGGVARTGEHTAEEIHDVVYAVRNAVHRNLQQKMVPLTEQEEDEINEAVKSSVEQSLSNNASPAEIGEQVKKTVADILAVEQNLPLGRENNFWSSLEEDAVKAVQENLVSLDHSSAAVPPFKLTAAMVLDVHAVQNAVHRNLEQKMVALTLQDEDEIDDAIERSLDESVSHYVLPSVIAENVKEAVANLLAVKHDLPLGREFALWDSIRRDVEETILKSLASENVANQESGREARKQRHQAARISAVVFAVLPAVYLNLQQKMVPLTKQDEDEVDEAIKKSVEQSISHDESPAEIAEKVKEAVANLLAVKHDLPLGREVALWESIRRDVEEAVQRSLVPIERSSGFPNRRFSDSYFVN